MNDPNMLQRQPQVRPASAAVPMNQGSNSPAPMRYIPFRQEAPLEDRKNPTFRLVENLLKLGASEMLSLLDDGADPNAKDPSGCTPFMMVSIWGMTDHMKALAIRGADVGAANSARATALIIISCFKDSPGYIGADVMTLMLALAKRQYKGDKTSEFRNFVNAKNAFNESALDCARKHGLTQLAEILKAAGATG